MAVPKGYKTVTCYLPPEIAEQLKAYCFKHEITRNNKQGELSPSWGTGIVEALKLFFSSDTVPSPLASNGLDRRMVEDIVKDSLNSILPSQLPNNAPSEDKLKELIQESVTNLFPSLLSSHVLTQDSPVLKELDNRLSQLEANQNQLDLEDDPVIVRNLTDYGVEVQQSDSLRSSDSPSAPSEQNNLNPIDKENTETISESEETQRLTDKEIQGILKQKYNIKTTPQTLSKWRLQESKPRGRNQIIFDLFKPDGDRWISLQS
ncbi:hypothetical protein [Crocosphaera sp. Alani8]|uniref:hypothetical protein n=1 Tax=Crocosphaera sp. Alani8 TaxID=3038952 RepID=UPI00313C5586